MKLFENYLRNHKNRNMGITFLIWARLAYIIYSIYYTHIYVCVCVFFEHTFVFKVCNGTLLKYLTYWLLGVPWTTLLSHVKWARLHVVQLSVSGCWIQLPVGTARGLKWDKQVRLTVGNWGDLKKWHIPHPKTNCYSILDFWWKVKKKKCDQHCRFFWFVGEEMSVFKWIACFRSWLLTQFNSHGVLPKQQHDGGLDTSACSQPVASAADATVYLQQKMSLLPWHPRSTTDLWSSLLWYKWCFHEKKNDTYSWKGLVFTNNHCVFTESTVCVTKLSSLWWWCLLLYQAVLL